MTRHFYGWDEKNISISVVYHIAHAHQIASRSLDFLLSTVSATSLLAGLLSPELKERLWRDR
jgi:hypothetical protein